VSVVLQQGHLQWMEYANQKRENEEGLEHRCSFCREPLPKSKEENEKRMMNRVEKNDPSAICHVGKNRRDKGDFKAAMECFTKAAGLEDAEAHFELSIMYRKCQGVEKDEKMEVYHLEKAAIAGHPWARHNLGTVEANNGRYERARKHFIIAANLGHDQSLKCLKRLYAEGHASKDNYANALRAYQAAVEATKSVEREEAEEYHEAMDAARQS
jgi:TPR repeat protein